MLDLPSADVGPCQTCWTGFFRNPDQWHWSPPALRILFRVSTPCAKHLSKEVDSAWQDAKSTSWVVTPIWFRRRLGMMRCSVDDSASCQISIWPSSRNSGNRTMPLRRSTACRAIVKPASLHLELLERHVRLQFICEIASTQCQIHAYFPQINRMVPGEFGLCWSAWWLTSRRNGDSFLGGMEARHRDQRPTVENTVL